MASWLRSVTWHRRGRRRECRWSADFSGRETGTQVWEPSIVAAKCPRQWLVICCYVKICVYYNAPFYLYQVVALKKLWQLYEVLFGNK